MNWKDNGYLKHNSEIFLYTSFQRINENRGWSADNPKAQSIRDTLLKMWDNLRQGADTDQDGQVKILFHQAQKLLHLDFLLILIMF